MNRYVMTPLTFSILWNGILQSKKITIEGLDIDTGGDDWKWKHPKNVTAQFEYRIEGVETRTATLETRCSLIANTIVLGLIHNDEQMITVILAIDESVDELICRIGKFTRVGEFNEMFYEEPELQERDEERRIRVVFGVDIYPEDLFEECC
jgi:hypothetical protein